MGNFNGRTGTKKAAGAGTKAMAITALSLAGLNTVNNANNNCNSGCGNNGIFSFLTGNGNNDCYVRKDTFDYAQASNAKDMYISYLEGKGYTDEVGIELYREIVSVSNTDNEKQDANLKEVRIAQEIKNNEFMTEIIRLREEAIKNQAKIDCLTIQNAAEHKALASEFNSALALESQTRACDDEKIVTYVNSNFIKGSLKLDADDICPQVKLKCEDVTQVEIISSAVTRAMAQYLEAISVKK